MTRAESVVPKGPVHGQFVGVLQQPVAPPRQVLLSNAGHPLAVRTHHELLQAKLAPRDPPGLPLRVEIPDPDLFSADAPLPIDLYGVAGGLFTVADLAKPDEAFLNGFMLGTLDLDEASTELGGTVSGSITADLVGMKF